MISRRTYALAGLILVMIVWGITYVVTKAAVREIPPLTLAAERSRGTPMADRHQHATAHLEVAR